MMCNHGITPDGSVRSREALGFVAAVRRAFAPLVAEHRLNEVASDLNNVHYKSQAGWLTVTHDPLSFELDISFAPTEGGTDRPFGMVDFIRVADWDRADTYRSFAATSPDGVHRGVEQLAGDLRRYAEPALRSDSAFVEHLTHAREEAIAEFGATVNRARDNQAADQAMRDHDWRRVLELYEPREDQLSRVERKRLDVARKRLASQ